MITFVYSLYNSIATCAFEFLFFFGFEDFFFFNSNYKPMIPPYVHACAG